MNKVLWFQMAISVFFFKEILQVKSDVLALSFLRVYQ